MMKVAYVLQHFPAISETFVLNEILEMQRQGVDVQVFACYPLKEDKRHPSLAELKRPPIYFPWASKTRRALAMLYYLLRHPGRTWRLWSMGGRRWSRTFKNTFYLAWLVERFGAERIHCHFATTAHDLGLYPSVLTGLPYSFTAHFHDIYFKLPANYRTFFERASQVITISHYNKNFLRDELGIPADKIHIIRCGINPDYFRPDPSAPKDIDILCVARLHPLKGLPYLIEACRKLRERGREINCVIIGEGAERENLEGLIKEQGLEGVVTLAGLKTQREVREYIRRARVVTLPSSSEGLGVVLMEALASEVPVVASRVLGVPELVEDGVNGFLTEPGDTDALADRFERLLADPELRRRLGAAGRRKVQRQFHLATEVAKLRGLWGAAPQRPAWGCARPRRGAEAVSGRNHQPLVSVVIPTYNRAQFLREAIESVLAQTFTGWELIVVDNGSTDGTATLCASYGPKLTYLLEQRQGPAAARNRGIAAARGEFVAFLDDDDIWLPEKLARQLELMEQFPAAGVVGCGQRCMDLSGRVFYTEPGKPRYELAELKLRCGPVGTTSGALVRKACLEELGGFDEGLRFNEDWDLWLRIVRRYELRGVVEPLVVRRIHDLPRPRYQNDLLVANTRRVIDRHVEPGAARRRAYGWMYYKSALRLSRQSHLAALAELGRSFWACPAKIDGADRRLRFLWECALPKPLFEGLARVHRLVRKAAYKA
mgnify:CR=1 FL=1